MNAGHWSRRDACRLGALLGNVHHVLDNLAAGFGPLPDAATRERMVRFVESL